MCRGRAPDPDTDLPAIDAVERSGGGPPGNSGRSGEFSLVSPRDCALDGALSSFCLFKGGGPNEPRGNPPK